MNPPNEPTWKDRLRQRAQPHVGKFLMKAREQARLADGVTKALQTQLKEVTDAARAQLGGRGVMGAVEAVVVGDVSVRQAWRNRKGRLEGALRLARADVELADAYD